MIFALKRAEYFQDGWVWQLLCRLQEHGALTPVFGTREAALMWDGSLATEKCDKLRMCLLDAHVNKLREKLNHGKHEFLMVALPKWDVFRLLDHLCGSTRAYGAIKRWLLPEHDLAVEIGRYQGLPRHARHCKACLSRGRGRVQTEIHLLGEVVEDWVCPIAAVERVIAIHQLEDLLEQYVPTEQFHTLSSLHETFAFIPFVAVGVAHKFG